MNDVKRLFNIYGFDGGNYAGNVYEQKGLSPALKTMTGGNRQPIIIERRKDLERIRKLTPCECWRLQGFSDITKTEDGYSFDDTLFKRAESVCSNSQLYKQAGNSITVDVLCHIFENLFINSTSDNYQITIEDICT